MAFCRPERQSRAQKGAVEPQERQINVARDGADKPTPTRIASSLAISGAKENEMKFVIKRDSDFGDDYMGNPRTPIVCSFRIVYHSVSDDHGKARRVIEVGSMEQLKKLALEMKDDLSVSFKSPNGMDAEGTITIGVPCGGGMA